MAKMRKGNNVTSRLCCLAFGEPFSGKTSWALNAAFLKTPEGRPFRIVVFDTESGGSDEAIERMVSQGIDADNILVLYTQSQKEIKEYINKIAKNEDFYIIDENDEETDEVVLDADGNPFRADLLIIDSISVLKMTSQQSLLELSRKRNKLKAQRAGASSEELFIAVQNSGLELRDYQMQNFAGQDLVLALMSSGCHVIMTARSTDEKKSVPDGNGKTTSVCTGRKTYEGLKGADYNVKQFFEFFRDEETGEVCMKVHKDRSNTYEENQVVVDPSIIDFQSLISGNKGKNSFILRNDLDKAVETDQKLFEKEVIGDVIESNATSKPDIDSIKSEINTKIRSLPLPKKQELKSKLTENNLPTAFSKITDPSVLNKILEIVNQ